MQLPLMASSRIQERPLILRSAQLIKRDDGDFAIPVFVRNKLAGEGYLCWL